MAADRPLRPPGLWWDTLTDPEPHRSPLTGTDRADSVIVGGGFTGLWTALHLLRNDPTHRVIVLERHLCGFGASGRNGGWCSALSPTPFAQVEARHGEEAARALAAALRWAVGRVGTVAGEEGIDCHFHRGGTLTLVTDPAHRERVEAGLTEERRWLDDPDEVSWLEGDDLEDRWRSPSASAAAFTPHCAALHPARLVRGLARAVERRGGRIHEGTPATAILPRRVTTPSGTVHADNVLVCTEAWTATLPRQRREIVPLYSLMIATSPLDASTWERIGLTHRETFTDGRHLLIYGQRTADGRLAFGGRGAPYHFGSRIAPRHDLHPPTFDELERTLRSLVDLGGAPVTHRWGGPLGVPRDFSPSISYDPSTGLGSAGGYVGDGVAYSFLAGLTLAHLTSGRAEGASSNLTGLAPVGHRSPRWEPEPLRWGGINAVRLLAALADRREQRTHRPAERIARLVEGVTGGAH